MADALQVAGGLGLFLLGMVTLSDGLQPGEWIATAGVHYLKEGQKVSIMDRPEG